MFWRAMFTAAMTVAMACAQGGMGGGGGMGGDMNGGMDRDGMGSGMRVRRQSPFDQFAEKLRLSRDQRIEAGTILQDAAKEMGPIREKLQQARQDLAGVLINGQTGDPVDQIVKAYAPLAAQVTGIEANAFAKICKTLKPGQQKNAPQAFGLLAEILDRPLTGGGGRSGR